MRCPNFIYFDELESTNTYAMKNLSILADMDVIVAARQTAGKGRFNRNWYSSNENNIYMSIVLKPSISLNNYFALSSLTQYMSVVICKILSIYEINAEIKWPNDVMVQNRKIAGILSEASIQGQSIKGIILGVGINLMLEPSDLQNINQPAMALNMITDNQVGKNEFIEKLMLEFVKNYEKFIQEGFLLIKDEYIKKSSFIGKTICITNENSKKTVVAKSITNNGELVIVDNNQEKILTTGNIEIVFEPSILKAAD